MDAVYFHSGVTTLLPARIIGIDGSDGAAVEQTFDQLLFGLLLKEVKFDFLGGGSSVGAIWNDLALSTLAQELARSQSQSLGRLLFQTLKGQTHPMEAVHDR